MNAIQLENEMKLLERHPRFFEHIDVAIVTNGFGHTVGIYSVRQLAKDWLHMGSESFHEVYGFDWVPPESLIHKDKKSAKGRNRK